MKREILKALKATNASLTLIERRIESIERTGATKAETANMARALTEVREELKDFRTNYVKLQEERNRQLEESAASLASRVLNLERSAGII
jgi:hypothetical protein